MVDRIITKRFEPSPALARVELALFILLAAFFVAVTLSPLRSGFADAPNRGPGDVELYRAEVDRIRAGASYYDALAFELRTRGYATHSLFNWRTPLPVWLIAQFPTIAWTNALLGTVCLILIAMTFRLLVEDGGLRQGCLAVVLLCGALLPCVLGDLAGMSELWSGVLIALSAVSFGLGKRSAGVAAALAALAFRELAAPFCLICLALAAWERRWRELAYWSAGLTAYAVSFGLHAWNVLPRLTPPDHAHIEGWFSFGGAGFLIATAQMNAYLLMAPQWLTGIYLACVLLGAATWNGPSGRIIVLTIAAYTVAFSFVGNNFNQYWGSMTAPLYCLAAARAPHAIARLTLIALDRGRGVASPLAAA